jgi:O-antigen ligase
MARWYGVAIGSGAAITVLITNPAIKPLWVLFGLLVLAAIIEGLLRFPAVMLVPVIFIPQWKELSIFKGLQSRVDLTLVSLIILCIVIIFNFIATLARGWKPKDFFAGQGKGIIAFFSFAAIVAMSYLYTPAPDWGFTQALRLCGIGGLLFLSPFILIREEKDFRQFAIAFVCFAMALAAEMIFLPRYAVDQWGWAYSMKTNIGGGWIIGMAILLLFYFPLTKSPFLKWSWRLACGPLLIVGLIATTARGPLVCLAFVFILTPLVLPRKRGARSKALTSLGILLAMVAASVVATSLLPQVRAKYQEKMTEIDRIMRGSWPGGTAGERLDFYQAALREIPENPVLGLGVGGWSVYYYGRDSKNYPHNLFLLVGVEEGLVGLIALMAFLCVVGLAIKRILAMAGDRYVVLFALVAFCVAVSMFSGDLDTNRLLWLWCGMTFALARMLRVASAIIQPSQDLGRSAELSYAMPTSGIYRAY